MGVRLGRPSPALVISVIALFVALGGTGYAALKVSGKHVKNRSLTGKDIKRNSLGRNEVKESSLAKVGSAGRADSAAVAGSAGSAGNASALGGRAPSAYLPGPFVAATLKNGWEKSSASASPTGYWIGPGPIVSIQLSVKGGATSTDVFTLPPGARPRTGKVAIIDCLTEDDFARLLVKPDGGVEVGGPADCVGAFGAAESSSVSVRIDN